MTVQAIETDYLVIGAGGMGMAFADELVTQTSARVAIVDRKHRPGGHWNDAYSFVRLHQSSACYGVNSTELGKRRIDKLGWNRGCYELASGSEVLAYFDTVMRERFLPSGRVQYLPLTEYKGDRRAASLVNGNEYQFSARKIVDATYLDVSVPSQRPPQFKVEGGAVAVPPNDLPRQVTLHRHFVIVGSGKTGFDACLFLLEHGVPHANITLIMPNDAWLFDRFTVNPGRGFTDVITTGRIDVLHAALAASSADDFFLRVMACDQLLCWDPKVKPTRWRCCTVTKLELEQLRKISDVVRMGHVHSVSPGLVQLQQGMHKVPDGAIFVDCAADGLKCQPVTKVFTSETITLQTMRMCQPVYSGGFIGNVEINVRDESRKNQLCRPVPLPYFSSDYLRCAIQDSENLLIWLSEPAVVKWINESRTDLFSPILDFDDPECSENIQALGKLLRIAIPKMKRLLDVGLEHAA